MTQQVDYSNFDTSNDDSSREKKFSVLAAGTYVFRVTGFQRNKTKKGDDSLVFKLVAQEGLTPGCSQGDCIWFVNLTQRGRVFVIEALEAVQGPGWRGNLMSDDEVKQAFLGRVLKANINHEYRNGRTYASVTGVGPFQNEDHVHLSPDAYWNNPALGRPAPASGSSQSKGFTSDPDVSEANTFSDDDIPF